MPEDTFLQKFHDLGSADEDKRCRAARGMKLALQSDRLGSEDLTYTIRRLVRGVQSSRQCCRQGFCLALAEVLQAFPEQLATVLKQVDQTAELQSGLKATEQKERLIGRLLVYAAVLQAGSLRADSEEPVAPDVLGTLGRGLLQIYNARPYLAPVAVSILADICGDLCQSGRSSQVPEVLSDWKLDQKVGDGSGLSMLDGHVCGLVISLRRAYEDTLLGGAAASSLKSWPSCVRKDILQGDALPQVAKSVGKALASLPVGDPVPPVLASFCKWWARPYKGRDPVALQSQIWPALEEGLFPDKRSQAALAQGFRGMAELASSLRSAGDDAKVDEIIAGFFQHLETGWNMLLGSMAWTKSPAFQSAMHAHARLVAIVGGPRDLPAHGKAHHQKKGNQKKHQSEENAQRQDAGQPEWISLKDETRLTILEALQSRKEFEKVPSNCKRQWQQALLAPLSPPGVRSRCGSLIASMAKGKGPSTRVAIAQLENLAVHSKAPDEVILAVVFLIFTTAYFGGGEGTPGTYSLRSFKEAVGLPSMPSEADDVGVPVVKLSEEERDSWRMKLWSALAALSRRTFPEAAERLVTGAAEGELSANEAFSGGEEGPGSLVRSLAYQGCLGDGSYLILRVHQWWDHLLSQGPSVAGAGSPSKKKRKTDAGGLQCMVELKEDELALRTRAVETCKLINELEEGRGGLSARQKNAICSLPLSLALTLIEENLTGREAVTETLGELLDILEEIERVAKTTNKTKKKIAENLAAIPPVAAELFVQDTPALVREAARMAWRELGYFASEDTLKSLCESVCGSPAENEADEAEGEEDEDDDDEGLTPAGANRKAAFDDAIQALKEGGAKEANDEDEEDVTTLDNAGVLSQLLDGDDNSELLESFAKSGLEGADTTQAKKLTKRQKKLRRKQEEAVRRLREVDLVEMFLVRFGAKRTTSLHMLQELYTAMVRLMHKAKVQSGGQEAGDKADNEQGKGKQKNRKKSQSKADSELKRLEETLALRIHKLLQRLLKHICRPAVIQTLAGWHSPDEWAEHARALCAQGQTPKVCVNGPRPLEVGSAMLYFFCAAHRAATAAEAEEELTQKPPLAGWTLAEELLALLLDEWGGKKDCDNWCQAAMKAFAARVPQLLHQLKWAEAIRSSRKVYTHRMQIAFVATNVLRLPLPGATEEETASALAFADSFAILCSEVVESTLKKEEEGAGAAQPGHKQTYKLRREGLNALKSALRLRQKSGEATKTIPPAVATSAANAVAGLRDSLPNQQKQGEVYQLCVHILRIVRPQVSNQSSKRKDRENGDERPGKKQKNGSEGRSRGDEASREKKRRGRGRSASGSRSPSAKPAPSPSLRPSSPSLKPKRPRSKS